MKLKSISQLKNLKGKKVLLRVDFNVPVKDGKVKSDYKIVKSLPTIEYLVKKGARVILLSHLGRPKGFDKNLSLQPVISHAENLLRHEIALCPEIREWEIITQQVGQLKNGHILALENIRFFKGEEDDDPKFSKKLASLADIFVLDGFAVAHRKASSVTGAAKYLPSYAGLLLAEEVTVLSRAMTKPKRPMVVILGGAKTETKIPLLKKFLKVADHILIGGGIFNTYLLAQGKKVGGSIVSSDLKYEVKRYLSNKKVVLPIDVVVGKENGDNAHLLTVDKVHVSRSEAIYDIGPGTASLYAAYLKKANTLIMNGALGKFEQRPYQFGTYSLAHLFAARSKGKALGIAGGGETVEILEHLKLMSDVDLVSTGGGALLEFLSGTKLPGLKALEKK